MATAKGYTDHLLVLNLLGIDAASEVRIAQATALIPAAEARIDAYCHRAWLVGVQTNEAHYAPFGCDLYVLYPPCSAISAVAGRTGLTATEATLVAATDYEVQSLTAGRIRLVAPGLYDRLRVTYTPLTTIPADVQLAATMLTAHWLQTSLRQDLYGVESYRLPDLEVTYSRWSVTQDMPPSVESLLDPYRFVAVA